LQLYRFVFDDNSGWDTAEERPHAGTRAPMHRRYERVNIPIEVIRTFVCIVENGSFSKAGRLLGLSQPAITAQMKRLQMIVGAPVFDRARGGAALTERGALVLSHAKRILDETDRILSLGGATSDWQPIRIGLSSLYAEEFFKGLAPNGREQLTILCSRPAELEKSLADGYLDIACQFNPPGSPPGPTPDWNETFVWARSRNFVLRPGSPIPLVCLPGRLEDQPVIRALETNGLAYRLAFMSYDVTARFAAVSAGFGLIGLPERYVKEPLVVAKEYYLPPLPTLRAGIRVRAGLPMNDRIEAIIRQLMTLAPAEIDPERRATNRSA
jgi:DNA-binding transcriptional LysR family regulator